MTQNLSPLDQWLDERGIEDVMRLDPGPEFDRFVLGVADRLNHTFLVYDRDALLRHFETQGMDPCDAEEYFDFNVRGAWVGDGTPAFLTLREEVAATLTKPPGHTCPAIDGLQHILRQMIWRMDNPDRPTRQSMRDLYCDGLALLERVRAENAEMRAAYYSMKKTQKETP